MENNNLKYSVLMSVYNKVKPEELELSITSMLNQTVKPEQFVIVTDGPVNDSLEQLICTFEKNNEDIFTIVRLEKNSGLGHALNHGLKYCRNNYVARMDSDDYSLPERCEKQILKLNANNKLAMVGTGAQLFKNDINEPDKTDKFVPETNEEIKKALRRNNPFIHSSVMFKKDVVEKCGSYDVSLRRRQDYDLFSKMSSFGYELYNIREALLLFRFDDMCVERNRNKETCRARLEVQKRILKRHECSFADYAVIWLEMKISMIVPSGLYKKVYVFLKNRNKKVEI